MKKMRFEIIDAGNVKEEVYQVPSNYNELSAADFRTVFKILIGRRSKFRLRAHILHKLMADFHANELLSADPLFPERLQILHTIMKLPDARWAEMSVVEVVHIMNSFSWTEDYHNINMFDSKLPRVGVAYGPKSKLHQFDMRTMGRADKVLELLGKQGGHFDIAYLFALLYRPFGISVPDAFIPFYRKLCKLFVANHTLVAAYINYKALRNNFAKRYPKTHSPETEIDDSGVRITNYGHRGLVVAVAGSKLGDVKRVQKTDINDVFVHLEKLNEEYQKSKKKS